MGKATEDLKMYGLGLGSMAALFGIAAVNDIYQGIKKTAMESLGYEAIPRDVGEMELRKYGFRKIGSGGHE
ncbi:MAG: hypothetical protein KAT35_01290 [Candidatus Aenigmarchaeota archaeon]|nr:hypothetical protein [Candidatus Aenigmarchaeota archaeon]